MTGAIASQTREITWLRRYVLAAGVAAVLGALVSAAVPLHLDASDQQGRSLQCGSALLPREAAVVAEDGLNALRHEQDPDLFHLSDYTAECAAWTNAKRCAALGVGSGGAITITAAAVLLHPRRRQRTVHAATRWITPRQAVEVDPTRSHTSRCA